MAPVKTAFTVTSAEGLRVKLAVVERISPVSELIHPWKVPLLAVAARAIPSARVTPSFTYPSVTAVPSAVTLPNAESYAIVTLEASAAAAKLKLDIVKVAVLSPHPLLDCTYTSTLLPASNTAE